MIKKISITVILLSILSILYSFTMSPYINEEEYQKGYAAINLNEIDSRTASNQFFKLRAQHLSKKYSFQNYGFTFLILGASVLFLFRKGLSVNAPSPKLKIAFVGFVAALLTVGGYIGDLFLEFYRGAFPVWADSLGIPLTGVPILTSMLLLWAALMSLTLIGKFEAGAQISFKQIRGLNYFYLLLFVISTVIVLLCVVDGFFWLVLPGILWLYFYASLWSGRSVPQKH